MQRPMNPEGLPASLSLSRALPNSTENSQQTITKEIAKLLAHYYIPGLDPALEKAVARDWVRLLSEFAPEEVSKSCEKWLKTESRRPTIADIRGLALRTRPKPDMAARQAAVMHIEYPADE